MAAVFKNIGGASALPAHCAATPLIKKDTSLENCHAKFLSCKLHALVAIQFFLHEAKLEFNYYTDAETATSFKYNCFLHHLKYCIDVFSHYTDIFASILLF